VIDHTAGDRFKMDGMGQDTTHYLAFRPEQFKHIENTGTYGMRDPRFLYQSAFHGTGKRGIEKFSTKYIGTGEGAQVYGWGLYFTESQDIAEWYRGNLTEGTKVLLDGKKDKPMRFMLEAKKLFDGATPTAAYVLWDRGDFGRQRAGLQG